MAIIDSIRPPIRLLDRLTTLQTRDWWAMWRGFSRVSGHSAVTSRVSYAMVQTAASAPLPVLKRA